MAGDWMKVEKVTPRKPEILEMAAILGLSADDVFGKLFRLWAWADDHTQDGNARGVTEKWIDRYLCADGFASALIQAGWVTSKSGELQFVNYDQRNMSAFASIGGAGSA